MQVKNAKNVLLLIVVNEPCHKKTDICIFAVTAQLISTFVFATRIVQQLFLILNLKFQAYSNLLRLIWV